MLLVKSFVLVVRALSILGTDKTPLAKKVLCVNQLSNLTPKGLDHSDLECLESHDTIDDAADTYGLYRPAPQTFYRHSYLKPHGNVKDWTLGEAIDSGSRHLDEAFSSLEVLESPGPTHATEPFPHLLPRHYELTNNILRLKGRELVYICRQLLEEFEQSYSQDCCCRDLTWRPCKHFTAQYT
ncbi:hypothetical protein TRVA0_053S01046 [Trichomonascus vanleenenianus]|uniref:uncharacterized protein n=1 Tax=Trichomonascus vanleenenianus TaxID=2268995 RepID=UPI003ECAD9E1